MKAVQEHPAQTTPEEDHSLSLCTFITGGALFGIETRRIKEVLGRRALRPVPLAPAYIAGIVPYRGEILTTVGLRTLLGLAPMRGQSYVVVLQDKESGDRFGLVVDAVAGVIIVDRRTGSENPSTLDARSALLYDGVFHGADGLLIQLSPAKLRPHRLAGNPLFREPIPLPRSTPTGEKNQIKGQPSD